MVEFLIDGFIFLLAGFVQGLTGFAFALLAVPLLSLFGSLKAAVGLMATVGFIIILYSCYLHRHEVEVRKILPLALVAVACIPLGALFLIRAPERIATIALGVVVIVLALGSMKMGEERLTVLQPRWIGYLFSAVSGLLGGAFSAPGPIVVAYLNATEPSPLKAKANTQLFFTFTSVGLFLTHLGGGTITLEVIGKALPLIPLSMAGTHLGVKLSSHLPTRVLRSLMDGGLVLLGGYLIVSRLY